MKQFLSIFAIISLCISISKSQTIDVSCPLGKLPAYIDDWGKNQNDIIIIVHSPSPFQNAHIVFDVFDAQNNRLASTKDKFAMQPMINLQVGAIPLRWDQLINKNAVSINSEIKDMAARTGRLPEGNFRLCTYMVDQTGKLLRDLSQSCTNFQVKEPTLPIIVSPINHSVYDFHSVPGTIWTPATNTDNLSFYKVKIFPVYSTQTAEQAVRVNVPLVESDFTQALTDMTWQKMFPEEDRLGWDRFSQGRYYVAQDKILPEANFSGIQPIEMENLKKFFSDQTLTLTKKNQDTSYYKDDEKSFIEFYLGKFAMQLLTFNQEKQPIGPNNGATPPDIIFTPRLKPYDLNPLGLQGGCNDGDTMVLSSTKIAHLTGVLAPDEKITIKENYNDPSTKSPTSKVYLMSVEEALKFVSDFHVFKSTYEIAIPVCDIDITCNILCLCKFRRWDYENAFAVTENKLSNFDLKTYSYTTGGNEPTIYSGLRMDSKEIHKILEEVSTSHHKYTINCEDEAARTRAKYWLSHHDGYYTDPTGNANKTPCTNGDIAERNNISRQFNFIIGRDFTGDITNDIYQPREVTLHKYFECVNGTWVPRCNFTIQNEKEYKTPGDPDNPLASEEHNKIEYEKLTEFIKNCEGKDPEKEKWLGKEKTSDSLGNTVDSLSKMVNNADTLGTIMCKCCPDKEMWTRLRDLLGAQLGSYTGFDGQEVRRAIQYLATELKFQWADEVSRAFLITLLKSIVDGFIPEEITAQTLQQLLKYILSFISDGEEGVDAEWLSKQLGEIFELFCKKHPKACGLLGEEPLKKLIEKTVIDITAGKVTNDFNQYPKTDCKRYQIVIADKEKNGYLKVNIYPLGISEDGNCCFEAKITFLFKEIDPIGRLDLPFRLMHVTVQWCCPPPHPLCKDCPSSLPFIKVDDLTSNGAPLISGDHIIGNPVSLAKPEEEPSKKEQSAAPCPCDKYHGEFTGLIGSTNSNIRDLHSRYLRGLVDKDFFTRMYKIYLQDVKESFDAWMNCIVRYYQQCPEKELMFRWYKNRKLLRLEYWQILDIEKEIAKEMGIDLITYP